MIKIQMNHQMKDKFILTIKFNKPINKNKNYLENFV